MSEAKLDRDLQSIHEARRLARAAREAQAIVEGFSQQQVDEVVAAMAAAGLRESGRLARLAHKETGYGNVADKTAKNDFVLEDVVAAMHGMRTVGILREDREGRVYEIAEPVGVVAGIIPSTNPTSTALFKCLIALKARCGIVLSPHPAAQDCIRASVDVVRAAAARAGAPAEIIGCMTRVSMDGTRELMNGEDTDLILATGGIALVKAAYSAGKPAYGVGPGNVPAYVHASAEVEKAVQDIVDGTTFDNGTLCSSEQSIVCDRRIAEEVRRQVVAQGGRFLEPDEVERLSELLITEEYLVNPEFVGRPATTIAAAAGIEVADDTRVLVCPLDGVGKSHPLSHEKLSPVLAYYEVEDWREGCERCIELLRFGGLGHTLAVHATDHDVVLEFGLRKPAHRVLVNTVAAVGAVGLTTNLFPSMTLGCGSWGNNITSDNIGPQHLVNVKRLAWEVRPFRRAGSDPNGSRRRSGVSPEAVVATAGDQEPSLEARATRFLERRGLLSSAPSSPPGAGRTTVVGVRGRRRDGGLSGATRSSAKASRTGTGSRGSRPTSTGLEPPRGRPLIRDVDGETQTTATPATGAAPAAGGADREGGRETPGIDPARAELPPVSDFVAEADVRRALDRGEKIGIGPDTILTPLARELGEEHQIFRRR